MSDHLEPDWEFNPASNESTSSQADVIVLSGPGLPDSWNSRDLSLVEYFPDIFIQTSLPETTSTILNVRGPEPAHALEYGESSGSKRKVDDETPQLATSQSEDIEGSPRESERKQLDDRPKRTRSAEIHNTTERRRRSRINDKIMALGELIPNCKKTDKASILDDAAVYIKALKLEAEMMSRARDPLYMPPTAFQSLQQFPCFPPYFTMRPWLQGMGGVGFGMNYPMFGLPPATIHPSLLPPAAGGLLPISETVPLPVSQAQIPSIPLQQLPETAAGSIFTPASVSERNSAFNQPLQSGESSSQFIQRISPSSQSFPIISQGSTTPFGTSYTVHATHIIPPPSLRDYLAAQNRQFDEEAGNDKSG